MKRLSAREIFYTSNNILSIPPDQIKRYNKIPSLLTAGKERGRKIARYTPAFERNEHGAFYPRYPMWPRTIGTECTGTLSYRSGKHTYGSCHMPLTPPTYVSRMVAACMKSYRADRNQVIHTSTCGTDSSRNFFSPSALPPAQEICGSSHDETDHCVRFYRRSDDINLSGCSRGLYHTRETRALHLLSLDKDPMELNGVKISARAVRVAYFKRISDVSIRNIISIINLNKIGSIN